MKKNRQWPAIPILFFLCLLFAPPCPAADTDTLILHSVDSTNWPDIRLVVSVRQDNRQLEKAVADEFAIVLDDNQELAVTRLTSRADAGMVTAALLAVDTSGTMRGKPLEEIRKALVLLASRKGKNDLLGLVSFNDDMFVNQDFTPDSALFQQGVASLKAGGKITVLYKTLLQGLEMLADPGLPGDRFLVILSDGKDEGVGYTLDDGIARAKALGIPVYAMGMVSSRVDPKYLDAMERMATLTGGEYMKVKNALDLGRAWLEITNRILQRQVIEVRVNADTDGRSHTLLVKHTAPDGGVVAARETITAPLIRTEKKAGAVTGAIQEPQAGTAKPEPAQQTAAGNVQSGQEKGWQALPAWMPIAAVVSGLVLFILLFLFFRRLRKPAAVPGAGSANESGAAAGTEVCANCGRSLPVGGGQCLFCSEQAPAAGQTPAATGWSLAVETPCLAFDLVVGSMSIGANPANDLVIDVDTVSGFHAEISGNGQEWMLKDLGSTNGTFLDDVPVLEPVALYDGAVVQFGSQVRGRIANTAGAV